MSKKRWLNCTDREGLSWLDEEFQALSLQNCTRVIAQMHNCQSVIGNPEGDADSRNPVISSGELQVFIAYTVYQSF